MNLDSHQEDEGIGTYAFVDQENEEMTPYEQYMYDNYFGMGDDFYEGRKINNRQKLFGILPITQTNITLK